jgi:IMP and pyridine-specific 5'-nucleotidase
VAPSFNDIRLVLNTSQIMSLARSGGIDLVTFDGDVTLYEDGQSVEPDSPIIPRILDLLRRGTKVGIVTAAGVRSSPPNHKADQDSTPKPDATTNVCMVF